MKSKSIMQGLVGPHILFTAAYLLFSAEVCTSSAKHKPRSGGMGNGNVATPQVKQTNKIEAVRYPVDKANNCIQLDAVQDDVAIASEQDDASPDTDRTTPSVQDDASSDTDTTIPSVKPSEQSIVQEVSNTSNLDQQQEKKSLPPPSPVTAVSDNIGLSSKEEKDRNRHGASLLSEVGKINHNSVNDIESGGNLPKDSSQTLIEDTVRGVSPEKVPEIEPPKKYAEQHSVKHEAGSLAANLQTTLIERRKGVDGDSEDSASESEGDHSEDERDN